MPILKRSKVLTFMAFSLESSVYGQAGAQCGDLFADTFLYSGVPQVVEHIAHERGRLHSIGLVETTGCDRRRSDPDAARHERRLRIVWHRVLIDRDVGTAQRRICVLAGHTLRD